MWKKMGTTYVFRSYTPFLQCYKSFLDSESVHLVRYIPYSHCRPKDLDMLLGENDLGSLLWRIVVVVLFAAAVLQEMTLIVDSVGSSAKSGQSEWPIIIFINILDEDESTLLTRVTRTLSRPWSTFRYRRWVAANLINSSPLKDWY